jgi:hypothetical protein
MSEIKIRVVTTTREKKQFIGFLWKIYDKDPNWVAPFWMDRLKLMDQEKNPFYKHSEAEFYIAERDGEMVGRIAAIVNHNHIKEHEEKVGFFGFFECIDDQAVAASLFNQAKKYLKEHGMEAMRGPANPSVNDEYGLLIDGFDRPPVVLMTYNPSYYPKLVDNCGLTKIKDLYAYDLHHTTYLTEKFARVNKMIQERHAFTIRQVDMKKFDQEVVIIKGLYNKAWSRNWGAVPMTPEEFDALAADLKMVIDPRLVLFIEKNNVPIGFSLTLPDINIALKKNRKGRLIPGFLRLLYHKNKYDYCRIVVLGVIPEYLNSGASGLLLYETGTRAVAIGMKGGEASWVLEDNVRMVRAAKAMAGRIYKTYRMYQMPI